MAEAVQMRKKQSRARYSQLPQSKDFEATYDGFVYIGGGRGSMDNASSDAMLPGLPQVKEAMKLLKKPKQARDIHPLFARGFETALAVKVAPTNLIVTVETDGKRQIVMDLPMHKVAYVVNVGRAVSIVAKRDAKNKSFKCHGFHVDSADTARSLAEVVAYNCERIHKALRRHTRALSTEIVQKTMKLIQNSKGRPAATADMFKPPSSDPISPPQDSALLRERQEAEEAVLNELEMALKEAVENRKSGRFSILFDALPSEDGTAAPPAYAEPSLHEQLLHALQQAEDDEDEEPQAVPSAEEVLTTFFDEEYSDEFARFVHNFEAFGSSDNLFNDSDAEEPAEITLDSEYFEVVGF
eukprot:m.107084 g.107084  ORF g.107084 m.107084 type:complete len:355 (+) comp15827_c0_seq1:254-1318(+)